MKWEKVSLESISTRIGDGLHGTPKYDDSGEFYFINGNNLADGKILIKEDTKRISSIEYDKIKKELNDKTVFVAINGTLGNIGLYRGEPVALGKSACYINVNEKSERLFVRYVLENQDFQTYALDFATGATIKNLGLKAVRDYSFNLPPLPTQRKIASILSAYDDLIENNLKRIKLLEEKARIEFKSIQKNEKLEFKKAVEVLQFSTGKLNSNAAVPNGLYAFFTCGQEILRTNTFSVDEEVVLLGGNNASAIYPVFYYRGKFDAYQRTYIIKPKSEFYISFKYLYFFWEGKLDYLKNISTGAATKFLTLKILNDIDVPLPNKKVMKDYETLTEPIFKLKAILAEQNTKLRETRDILLPRLMSGQIEI